MIEIKISLESAPAFMAALYREGLVFKAFERDGHMIVVFKGY